MALYPFRFNPIFKERPWGGQHLERMRGATPGGVPIGESWEISDREGAVSVIANGAFAGKSLRWLLENYKDDVLGNAGARHGRFPLLVKTIDAKRPLSLQVHPGEDLAARLHGEAKTEMWYVAKARRGAEIFVGLKRGTTRAEFETRVRDGTVIECMHRVTVSPGDAMFVPGGRVHALGGGMVVFEIQQNSDTTYRIFDWHLKDSNGRSRELHIENALRCIDFSDFEPAVIDNRAADPGNRTLADHDAFRIELRTVAETHEIATSGDFVILGGVRGEFICRWEDSGGLENQMTCNPGTFCLVPACTRSARLHGDPAAMLLVIRPGRR